MRIFQPFLPKYTHKCTLFWESNPPESAWEADAIPLGDSRIFPSIIAARGGSVKQIRFVCANLRKTYCALTKYALPE